jgi:hypothetical protein
MNIVAVMMKLDLQKLLGGLRTGRSRKSFGCSTRCEKEN